MARQVVRMNQAQVANYLPTYEQLFEPIKQVMKDFSAGEIDQPPRTRLGLPGNAAFLTMPAYIPSRDVLGVKNVSSIPQNADRNLPTHISTIQLFNTYGQLLCDIEGDDITGMRTAVASVVATRYLANPSSTTLAVVGAGVQAVTHIDAMLATQLPLRLINICNRTEERARKLVDYMKGKYPNCEFRYQPTVREAVENADIICTVTSSREPVLSLADVKPGVHLNVVGAAGSKEREVADDLMKFERLKIVADSYKGVYAEAGDVVQTGAKVYCELGELVGGDKTLSWDADNITLFKNNGLACLDVVTTHMVYLKYLKQNPGL